MQASFRKSHFAALVAVFSLCFAIPRIYGQGGNWGSISGTVTDPTGAVVPKASVEIRNVVSQYEQTTTIDSKGNFSFSNVPFNPYHMTVNAAGFAGVVRDVEVRSVVPTSVNVSLQVTGSRETVTVEANAGDLIENDPTFHSDIDRNLFEKLPLESTTSGLSSLVTLSTPGIAADSNRREGTRPLRARQHHQRKLVS